MNLNRSNKLNKKYYDNLYQAREDYRKQMKKIEIKILLIMIGIVLIINGILLYLKEK